MTVCGSQGLLDGAASVAIKQPHPTRAPVIFHDFLDNNQHRKSTPRLFSLTFDLRHFCMIMAKQRCLSDANLPYLEHLKQA